MPYVQYFPDQDPIWVPPNAQVQHTDMPNVRGCNGTENAFVFGGLPISDTTLLDTKPRTPDPLIISTQTEN